MTLHFVHVRKTGGTAIKHALRTRGVIETPYGDLVLHRHAFGLRDIGSRDHAFFCVRDPISRYRSGFLSRLRQGRPGHFRPWRPEERAAFERFATPQALALALASDNPDERTAAKAAMTDVRHLPPMSAALGGAQHVRAMRKRIVYIGRQETLRVDWPAIRELLALPAELELSTDPVIAHVQPDVEFDASLDEHACSILREWYAEDYRLLEACEDLRRSRGWGAGR